ncbi:MAG: hypothetical protein HKN05_04395 [Rhizobiales bacterium]|nr:hypothetical protein [Hyphomicrobiales bacterium]
MAQDLTKGAPPRISARLLGICCVLGAVTIFSVQDVVIKWLSGGYPLHEIVFIRATVAMCLTLAILVPLEGGYHNLLSKRIPLHLLRGLGGTPTPLSFEASRQFNSACTRAASSRRIQPTWTERHASALKHITALVDL